MKKYFIYLLRVVVFAGVLFIVFKHTNGGLLLKTLQRVSAGWLVAAFVIYAAKYSLLGVRWYFAMQANNQTMPLVKTVRAQIEIAFLEIMFPLPASEEGLKIAYMQQYSIPLSAAAATAMYDKMIGLCILLLILPFSFWLYGQKLLLFQEQSPWLQVCALLLVLSMVIYHRYLISNALAMFTKYVPLKLNWVNSLKTELQKKIAYPIILTSLLCAVIYALLGTAVAWLAVQALHRQASFIFLLGGIPLYYISAMLPLSIQGLGLYETALVFVLQQQGIDTETALAAGLLHLGFHLAIIVIGGSFYFLDKDKNQIEKLLLKLFTKA